MAWHDSQSGGRSEGVAAPARARTLHTAIREQLIGRVSPDHAAPHQASVPPVRSFRSSATVTRSVICSNPEVAIVVSARTSVSWAVYGRRVGSASQIRVPMPGQERWQAASAGRRGLGSAGGFPVAHDRNVTRSSIWCVRTRMVDRRSGKGQEPGPAACGGGWCL